MTPFCNFLTILFVTQRERYATKDKMNHYHIAGKFGGEKVWRIDSFQAFGERKFGELIDQPIGYQL